MRNFEELKELKEQGRTLIERKRDEFVRNSLLSDEFLEMLQKNKKPMDLMMSYYQCAVMEVETKFKVLNQEYSLQYDKNPIEGIKTRIKSYDSLLKKIRRKDIPLTLTAIEENIQDIAGVRVICSFPDDIYELAESFLKQDDITLIEKKDYIKNPKKNGYKSLHMIVEVPIYSSKGPLKEKVEIQLRTVAMDYWSVLEYQIFYKKTENEEVAKELKTYADEISELDAKMLKLRDKIEKM